MPGIQDKELAQQLAALCERAAAGTGIEVLEVELRGGGKARLVRAYIDKPGGVTHGDCELISERFGALLDSEEALLPDTYTLEVSSPGVDRKLVTSRDFERVVGQRIRIALREPVEGQKRLEGKLTGVDGGTLAVETNSGNFRVALAQVQKANLKFEW